MAKVSQLKALLLSSGLQRTNITLFNVINQLIDAVNSEAQSTTSGISSASGGVTTLKNRSYLTTSDESSKLPNSRKLVAGANISFDDAVANEMELNGDDWDVLTDGDVTEPEAITVDGKVIMAHIPN